MRRSRSFVLALAGLLVALVAAPASARGGDFTLNVIHGIPDAALGGDSTVDVCVDGAVAFTFGFTEFQAGISLPADASYDLAVAAPGTDCATVLLGADGFTAAPWTNISVVAHLTADGAPTLSVFENHISKRWWPRVIAHHTAEAPTVRLGVVVPFRGGEYLLPVTQFSNGDQFGPLPLPPNRELTFGLALPGTFDPLDGSELTATLSPRTTYLVYAVGTFPTSFAYVVIPVSR